MRRLRNLALGIALAHRLGVLLGHAIHAAHYRTVTHSRQTPRRRYATKEG
jgi:hypothetical protein